MGDQSTTRRKSIKGLPLRSRPQCLRMHHFPGPSTCVFFIFPCLSTCVCFSMPQCMRMNFHVSAHAYVFPCLSACVCNFWVVAPTYIILSFILSLQNSVITFVLRGCDSLSLVPYVPGPILATICRRANSTRHQLARFAP